MERSAVACSQSDGPVRPANDRNAPIPAIPPSQFRPGSGRSFKLSLNFKANISALDGIEWRRIHNQRITNRLHLGRLRYGNKHSCSKGWCNEAAAPVVRTAHSKIR